MLKSCSKNAQIQKDFSIAKWWLVYKQKLDSLVEVLIQILEFLPPFEFHWLLNYMFTQTAKCNVTLIQKQNFLCNNDLTFLTLKWMQMMTWIKTKPFQLTTWVLEVRMLKFKTIWLDKCLLSSLSPTCSGNQFALSPNPDSVFSLSKMNIA